MGDYEMRNQDIKIIFPLDVENSEQAPQVLADVAPHVDLVKVGLGLATNIGVPEAISLPRDVFDKDVFADLKFNDIPSTVAEAARAITRQRVKYFDVMACGGEKMMAAAVEAAKDEAKRIGTVKPRVIAVTVLTNLTWVDLIELGFQPPVYFNPAIKYDQDAFVTSIVMKWAQTAVNAGVDCLLSSPWEAEAMRKKWPEAEIFTPAIRLPDSPKNDQQRTATPYEAVKAGSNGLVVGRPIRIPPEGKTRQQVVREIRDDIARALGK